MRVARVLRKLARHDVGKWALTGGLAFEFHGRRRGLDGPARPWNDVDFVTGSFEDIPETLAEDFLFRHIHPHAPPGKTLLQLIDCDTALRIDVFRACPGTLGRAGKTRVVSLEDLMARTARLLLDLADGSPVAQKHAGDYLRFLGCVDEARVEDAWPDHRKPAHPATFREANELLRDLIRANANLLVTPKYSQDPNAVCVQCEPAGQFQLADPNVVLRLLGYC
jgi:hypothetical protein